MRPCCVALGRELIWVVSPDWFEEFYNEALAIIMSVACLERDRRTSLYISKHKQAPIKAITYIC